MRVSLRHTAITGSYIILFGRRTQFHNYTYDEVEQITEKKVNK